MISASITIFQALLHMAGSLVVVFVRLPGRDSRKFLLWAKKQSGTQPDITDCKATSGRVYILYRLYEADVTCPLWAGLT